MDDVNIHIDELVVDGDGQNVISGAEQVLRMIPTPHAQQIAASVDRAIGAALGAATEPGTA